MYDWKNDSTLLISTVSGDNFVYLSPRAIIYGELEMFLTGLGLNHLVQVFQQQQVDFDMFLQLTDEDLIKVITDVYLYCTLY